jgi:hypothetical protein
MPETWCFTCHNTCVDENAFDRHSRIIKIHRHDDCRGSIPQAFRASEDAASKINYPVIQVSKVQRRLHVTR